MGRETRCVHLFNIPKIILFNELINVSKVSLNRWKARKKILNNTKHRSKASITQETAQFFLLLITFLEDSAMEQS